MRTYERKCWTCDKAFQAQSGNTRYCDACVPKQNARDRKRDQDDKLTEIEPDYVSAYLDDKKVLHPWSLDRLGMPAGMNPYITRAEYEALSDIRSMAFKRRRSGVKA